MIFHLALNESRAGPSVHPYGGVGVWSSWRGKADRGATACIPASGLCKTTARAGKCHSGIRPEESMVVGGVFPHGPREPLGGDLEKEEAVQAGAGQEGRRARVAGSVLSSSYSDAKAKSWGLLSPSAAGAV